MIKSFTTGDITTRPFSTFKNWEIQNIDSSGKDFFGDSTYLTESIIIERGEKITSSFDPTSDPINPSGVYKRVVYSKIDSMFYRNGSNPLESFGVETFGADLETGNSEDRKLNGKFVSARINKNLWGDQIKPKSVHLRDYSQNGKIYDIYDDGSTNLFVSGSSFSTLQLLGASWIDASSSYWGTSSGVFSYTNDVGSVVTIDANEARWRLASGLDVDYAPDENSVQYDHSNERHVFYPRNEHFGEQVDVWGKYIIVGSSMDSSSLSTNKTGYASLFKFDSSSGGHRLIKKFFPPLTREGLIQTFGSESYDSVKSLFCVQPTESIDLFGSAVSVKDGFLAIGAPSGSFCQDPECGFVHVYDRRKGGIDNWGLINILQGPTGSGFGSSVSIDSDILAVGAPRENNNTGGVYIFRRKRFSSNGCDNVSTGSFWQKLVSENGMYETLMSEDGKLLFTETSTPSFVSGNYTWEFETHLTYSLSGQNDNFGWSLEANNGKLIVGCNTTQNFGYAVLYSCSYTSASLGACPTASWSVSNVFVPDDTNGDLPSNPLFTIEANVPYKGFGYSVALNGDNAAVGSLFDKAFLPYSGATGSARLLGAVYFYKNQLNTDCNQYGYQLVSKTFGDVVNNPNRFGYSISIDGLKAVVGSIPDKNRYSVDYVGGAYVLEGFGDISTISSSNLTGNVSLYVFDIANNGWTRNMIISREKEAGSPYNVFGRSVSVSQNFIVSGAPIYNSANQIHWNDIVDVGNQTSPSGGLPQSYSGSVFVYNFDNFRSNTHVGNVFYKNGQFVISNTSSLYQDIFTKNYDLKYKGSQTIFEHEYLVSVAPGEFNFSTNPTALIPDPLLFDVDENGLFSYSDVNLIMRYLTNSKFGQTDEESDNGIIVEQSPYEDDQWWGDQLLLTEEGDVLQLEQTGASYTTLSNAVYDQKAFNYIQTNLVDTMLLDIDGDGVIDLNDGALLVAYFQGILTNEIVSTYTNEKSTRRYSNQIKDYLDRYCGARTFDVKQDFLGYQWSSSFDLTGSYLAPYVTSIGLYDSGSLVAVAKLGRPIKNPANWPINFVVRFDT